MRPLLSQQQQEEADRVALQAGLKGALIGVGLGAAATFFTYKRSPNFRALSRPMQSSFVVSGGTAGFLFGADRASTAYMNRVLGYMDEEMAAQRGRPNENLSKLSTKDRAIRYLNEHRWSVIGFSWVASMVGALGYTFSSKYLTTQQKVVQARMYAQAATIAVLLASAGLSIYSGEDRKKHSQCDEPDEQLRAVLNMPTTTQETQQTHQEQEKKVTGKNDHPEGKQRTTVDPPSQQEQQQRVASHKENLQSGSKQTANQGTDDAPEGKQRGYAEKLSSEEQLGRVASNKEDVWSSGKQLSNKQATSLETQDSNH